MGDTAIVGPGSVRELAEASQVAQHEVIAQVLKEAQPYIEALRNHTLVIKLGGSALENQRDALEDIVWLRGLGARPVLVHGGGAEINDWLERLGIPKQFRRGLRVTDAATLDVVRMVLAGKLNGELVRLVGELGGKAVGLNGIDGGLLRARQSRPGAGLRRDGERGQSRTSGGALGGGLHPGHRAAGPGRGRADLQHQRR